MLAQTTRSDIAAALMPLELGLLPIKSSLCEGSGSETSICVLAPVLQEYASVISLATHAYGWFPYETSQSFTFTRTSIGQLFDRLMQDYLGDCQRLLPVSNLQIREFVAS